MCSQRGKTKVFIESVVVPLSPLVFPSPGFVCFFVWSSWCHGSVCVCGIHTNHPRVERQGSDDAPVIAILVKATFQSWLHCRRDLHFFAAQSWFLCRRLLLAYQQRASTPPRKSCSRSMMLEVSRRRSARRCVLLPPVCWVVAILLCVAWPFCLPTCGRPLFAAFGFRWAKFSATIPLPNLGMSRWCGVSRVYAWASLRTTRRAQLLTLRERDWFSVVPRLRAGRSGPTVVVTTAERPLELSVVLDPALDSGLARPPQPNVLDVLTSNVDLFFQL